MTKPNDPLDIMLILGLACAGASFVLVVAVMLSGLPTYHSAQWALGATYGILLGFAFGVSGHWLHRRWNGRRRG